MPACCQREAGEAEGGRERWALRTSSRLQLGYQGALHSPVSRGSSAAAAWRQDMLRRLPWQLPGGWGRLADTASQQLQRRSQGQEGSALSLLQCCRVPHGTVPYVWVYLDCEAQDLDTHATHIGSCHLPHQLGKLVPVLVDLLHCQGTCRGEEGKALYMGEITHNGVSLSSTTSLWSLISSDPGTRA